MKLVPMFRARSFLASCILLSFFFIQQSCKKLDNESTQSFQNMIVKDKFLSVPATAPRAIKRIAAEFLRQENIRPGFIAEFASRNGYLLWNKAEFSVKSNVANRGGEGDTTVFIPFQLVNEGVLRGFIRADVEEMVKLFIYASKDYEALPSSQNYSDTVFSRQKFALVMMELQKEVTGDSVFIITDSTLFEYNGQPFRTMRINSLSKYAPAAAVPSWCFDVTIQIYVHIHDPYYLFSFW